MSTSWRDDDEDFKVGGVKGGLRSKPRFSFTEVKLLLEAVKRNRYIILRKFNQGVSAEAKKQTWTEITNQINGLGENHREVRQIMKKWADLKCDGKRRIVALRGPNGNSLRKKNLGAVERMVHKILMMSPRGDGESDPDIDEDDFPKPYSKPYSYLSLTDGPHSLAGGASFEISPLSSPEKEPGDAIEPLHSSSELDLEMGDDGERTMDFDENDDSLFSSHPSSLPPPSSASLDPLPDNVLPRVKPVYTYSRNSSQNHNHIQNHNYSRPVASTSSAFPPLSDTDALPPPPPLSQSPANSGRPAPSSSTPVAAGDSTSVPAPPATSAAVTAAPSSFVSSAGLPPLPPPSFSSSSSVLPPPASGSGSSSDPLPAGASSSGRPLDNVVQMASQSLQQQRASRMLLTSVSQSMEVLAQSVQLLVESQQEFVQESLLLQRETVDILRDFSNTALAMLRDKSNSGHLGTHHLPSSHS